jgi:Uma2 family endonuclease
MKRHIYQRSGVSEYWIVDIDSRVIERWRPDDDRPEVCEKTLAWALPSGPSGAIELDELFAGR